MSGAAKWSDRKLLMLLSGGIVCIVVGVGIFAPAGAPDNPQPTTYNASSAGTKAAFLTLQGMGLDVQRWEKTPGELKDVEAAKTTLVLTQPEVNAQQGKDVAAALKQFLERGGRVLLTDGSGALLPDGETATPVVNRELCKTKPEGPNALAAAGEVEMAETRKWTAEGPQFRVSQRCGKDAVVVRYPVGKGEAVWWSSTTPMSNAGLKQDASLKLLLASLYGDGGEQRTVLFDEYLHVEREAADPTAGLPLHWLELEGVMIFVLLVLSFSRRKGPLRLPLRVPRSSPVEFAVSMGDLYEKAGVTTAATAAAQRRLVRMLQREAGLGRSTMDEGPAAVAETLTQRLGGDWTLVAKHLRDAELAAKTKVAPSSALALVRAMAEDEERVRTALRPGIAAAV